MRHFLRHLESVDSKRLGPFWRGVAQSGATPKSKKENPYEPKRLLGVVSWLGSSKEGSLVGAVWGVPDGPVDGILELVEVAGVVLLGGLPLVHSFTADWVA